MGPLTLFNTTRSSAVLLSPSLRLSLFRVLEKRCSDCEASMASFAASRLRTVFGGTKALMAPAKTASTSTVKPKKSPTATTTTTTTGPANMGLQKMVPISPLLGKFLGGATESSRPLAIKKVWEYVKLHNLQNPANKREIFCDEKLKSIFPGKDAVGFQEVTKLLSIHFVKSG